MIQPIRIQAIGQAMDNGSPNTRGSGERKRVTSGQVTASRLSRNKPIASLRIRGRIKWLLCGGQNAVCDTLAMEQIVHRVCKERVKRYASFPDVADFVEFEASQSHDVFSCRTAQIT